MIKIISLLPFLYILLNASQLIVGAGGFDVSKKGTHYSFKNHETNTTRINITEVLQKEAKNVNSVTIWITRNWQEEWYDANEVQQNIINKGYIPVFVFYYFADEISPTFIQDNKTTYYQQLKKFVHYLKKIDGQKIVILNPEYNMFGCEKLQSMNELFIKSFKIVRKDPQTIVGPCVGDFGNYSLTNEPQEWKLFDPSLNKAVKEADFIAFQEMRALTRNSKQDILNTPQRAYYLSKYLYKTYKKPTMLAYLAISSYGKDAEEIQAEVYKSFLHYLPKMQKEAKLIFFGIFHYFDYPSHVGYFNEAEEFFGVVRKDGTKKPSYKYFTKIH